MQDPHRPKPRREVLSTDVSERLLERAAELDAAQRAAAEITSLRAAATEAGISPTAFDAALDEMRGGRQTPAARSPARRPRIPALVLGVAAIILAATVTVSRVVQSPAVPMIEQAFVLRCLPPGEGAELLRPVLDPVSTVRFSPTRAPRVLTVRGTADQMREVGAILTRQDGAACEAPAATR